MFAQREGRSAVETIVVLTTRERTRRLMRGTLPRRFCRALFTRTAAEVEGHIRSELVDAVVVDLSGAGEEPWLAIASARDFPSIPFFALTTLRPTDGPALARAVAAECADVLVDGVDDAAIRDLILPRGYTSRFAAALVDPPASLRVETDLQRAAWRVVVGQAGRTIRTDQISAALGVTREHLSRAFGETSSANIKRLIDFVRLASAAELSKNPGLDVGDVARVLGFASSSHLSTTAQRIIGTKPSSLARLRTVDLVNRFVHGRTRSRA